MGKLYDLAVKTRTYTDRDGNQKGVWKNVGSIVETRDGGKVILMDRTFNPAGVPVEDGRDQIMISMFKPQQRDQGAPSASASVADMADDIPF